MRPTTAITTTTTTAFALILALAIGDTTAQTVVIPAGYANTEGNDVATYPFGRGSSGCRVQYVYDTAALQAAGITSPVRIDSIAWRSNGGASLAGGSYSGASVTLKLGTCAFDHLALSNTFTANFATSTSWTLGPVVVGAGAGTTPNVFTTTLTIPGGFFYDPTAGDDLVVEVAFSGSTWTGNSGNSTASSMDVVSGASIGASRLFASSPGLPSTSRQYGKAAVLRLVCTPALPAAVTTVYGTGCGDTFASFYQTLGSPTATAAALSNTAIRLQRQNGGYVVSPAAPGIMPPSPAATVLTLTDDDETTVGLVGAMPVPGGTTSALVVCSNGFVSAGPGNGAPYASSPFALLQAPVTAWYSWHDFAPDIAGSGPITYEQLGGTAIVTWNDVWHWSGTSNLDASTVQFRFDIATGDVTIVWGNLSALLDDHLVGFSPGGASADPGSTTFATGLPRSLWANDAAALSLAVNAPPVLGTTITYTIGQIPPNALLALHLVSLGGVDAGVDLSSFGLTGCRQYVNFTTAATSLVFGAPTATRTYAVPSSTSLVGLSLDNQAAALVNGVNPGGVIFSNAVLSVLGGL